MRRKLSSVVFLDSKTGRSKVGSAKASDFGPLEIGQFEANWHAGNMSRLHPSIRNPKFKMCVLLADYECHMEARF